MIVYLTKQYQAVPALWPLYQALGGEFVTTRPSTKRALRRVYPGTPVTLLRESFGRFSRGDKLLRQAKAIVTGSPNRALLSRYLADKYMVFHGTYAFISDEEIAGLRHFDHVCAIGPRMYESLMASDLQEKVILSGYLPFLDFPQRTSELRQKFLTQVGLSPEAETVLYLPRGKPYGSWNVMAEKLVRETPSHYNLILRPHPSQSVTARLKDWLSFMRIKKLCQERGRALLDLTSCKLSTLFAVANLVITDGASSPEEALYYDLPLLFVESTGSSPDAIAAMMRRKKLTEEYISKILTIYNCGMRISPDDHRLSHVISMSIIEAERFKMHREKYFKWVFGDRGTDRQKKFINQLSLV